MTEALGAHRAGVWSLSRVDAKVCFEVLHAVELSVAHRTAERAAAWWVKLQPGPLASCDSLQTALLELLLALAVVPPQQTGQREALTAGLASVAGGEVVAVGAPDPNMDSIHLRRGFGDGSRFCQLEDGEVRGEGWKSCVWWDVCSYAQRWNCKNKYHRLNCMLHVKRKFSGPPTFSAHCCVLHVNFYEATLTVNTAFRLLG